MSSKNTDEQLQVTDTVQESVDTYLVECSITRRGQRLLTRTYKRGHSLQSLEAR
jgi:hypothetical protein